MMKQMKLLANFLSFEFVVAINGKQTSSCTCKDVFGVVVKDCESVVHCTLSAHTDVLAGGDEFSAAFDSRVTHFELYDGVRVLLLVIIGDMESIIEPLEPLLGQGRTIHRGRGHVPPKP